MARIVVLVHENDVFDRIYLMHEVAEVWTEQGHEVIVQSGPRGPLPDGDLLVNHVDLTHVPPDYMAAIRHYPKTLNGRVLDISKRAVSRHLVREQDEFDGPVVVKANMNSGGWREARLGAAPVVPEYRIYASKDEVPEFAWKNQALVVERFLPERIDGYFCLRTWFFLGDQRGHGLVYSDDPIVKLRTVVKGEILQEPPPEALQQMREELAFDFGKFDYGISGGEVVLYDANRTPTLGDIPKEHYINLVTRLANGVGAYL